MIQFKENMFSTGWFTHQLGIPSYFYIPVLPKAILFFVWPKQMSSSFWFVNFHMFWMSLLFYWYIPSSKIILLRYSSIPQSRKKGEHMNPNFTFLQEQFPICSYQYLCLQEHRPLDHGVFHFFRPLKVPNATWKNAGVFRPHMPFGNPQPGLPVGSSIRIGKECLDACGLVSGSGGVWTTHLPRTRLYGVPRSCKGFKVSNATQMVVKKGSDFCAQAKKTYVKPTFCCVNRC